MDRPTHSPSPPRDPESKVRAGTDIPRSFARRGWDAFLRAVPLPFLRPTPSVSIESIVGTEENVVMNACVTNCGSRCPLKCHVVDGVIRWITQEDNDGTGEDVFGSHQVRGCLRGRSARRRVYADDRLKYPDEARRQARRGHVRAYFVGRGDPHRRRSAQIHDRHLRQRGRLLPLRIGNHRLQFRRPQFVPPISCGFSAAISTITTPTATARSVLPCRSPTARAMSGREA